MEEYKLSIQIKTTDQDDVFFIYSKEMKCEYVIKKDLNTLKNEIADLIEEWIDIRGAL